jgi:hypothetical protein
MKTRDGALDAITPSLEACTVLLQGIGRVPAVPAEDLRPGNVVMFNYGKTAQVLSIQPHQNLKYLSIQLRHAAAGTACQPHDHVQRRPKDDLVPLSPLPEHRDLNPQVAGILRQLDGLMPEH